MIIVAGHIDLPAAAAEAGSALALDMMAETRKETGCIVYNILADLETPGRFHVYEEWESLPALAAHGEAPHMAVFRAGLKELGVIARDVKRMDAGPATPL